MGGLLGRVGFSHEASLDRAESHASETPPMASVPVNTSMLRELLTWNTALALGGPP